MRRKAKRDFKKGKWPFFEFSVFFILFFIFLLFGKRHAGGPVHLEINLVLPNTMLSVSLISTKEYYPWLNNYQDRMVN